MNLAPLLSFIRKHEAPKGYDQVWGGIRRQHLPPKPLSTMTVREVLAWQNKIDPLYNSEAAGAYQVMEDTLRANYAAAGLGLDDLFDVSTQDRFATYLLRHRGLDAYMAGRMTAEAFANSLAKEWASLPVVTPIRRAGGGRTWIVPAGASYYAGDGFNKALTPVKPFMDVVRAVREPVASVPVAGGADGVAGLLVTGAMGVGAIVAAFWDQLVAWFGG